VFGFHGNTIASANSPVLVQVLSCEVVIFLERHILVKANVTGVDHVNDKEVTHDEVL
jgi:hypothetical protein